MIRAIVVDDEENGRQALRNLLREYCPTVRAVDEAASVGQAREAILRHAPDVVFLDIELPGENGFDLLSSIHPDHRKFSVIFVTAHNHYALRAIKASAMDYLLKPIDIDELRAAVAKLEPPPPAEPTSREPDAGQVETVLENFRGGTYVVTRVALPTAHGLRLVSAADIIRCEGDNNYSTFYLVGGDKVIVSRTIREFESILSESSFVRVHKSHLINLRHVKQYVRETQRDSGGHVVMANGNNVDVSRRKKEELLRRIHQQG